MKMFGCPKAGLTKYPFLFKRDYSIGEQKKIGFFVRFFNLDRFSYSTRWKFLLNGMIRTIHL